MVSIRLHCVDLDRGHPSNAETGARSGGANGDGFGGLRGTATTFIISPWPAIDGLWFISVGVVLRMAGRSVNTFLGYVMIGAACLFKQNFFVLGPVFLIVLGDWRRFRYWLAVTLPGFAYLAFMWITGAFHDFTLQLASHTELIETGFYRYLHSSGIYCGFIVAGLGLLVVSGGLKTPMLNCPVPPGCGWFQSERRSLLFP